MNLEQLHALAEETREAQGKVPHRFNVCMAASCQSRGAEGVCSALRSELDGAGHADCEVRPVGCMGLCSAGPLVEWEQSQQSVPVDSFQTMYRGVQAKDAADLVAGLESGPVERLRQPTDIPFFTQQRRVVLENSGRLDPERLEDYVARDGYQALLHVLTEMDPGSVIEEVITSGLRGRGGGGFPTGLKWSTVGKSHSVEKYVICNADEGDPGAFMDRAVLESDPHRVIEGMIIAGYAVGASHGYIYVRAEYPLAIKRLQQAVRDATRRGLLGPNLCETKFSFNIELRLGAGAFVCGEETALIASIEGGRGLPHPRPPYPANVGLFGKPTLINNVETFANIAPIIRNGGRWFADIGTASSRGTKVFALAGKIKHSGLIEVPMGVSLREIIFDLGGGIPEGKKFKAVQTGGPSGGCMPEQCLDMPVDYESLVKAGSIMGSGGMIVMDESSSMVDVARFFMEFCKDESCGKCVPCRVGTYQMLGLLEKLLRKEATRKDLDLLKHLCDVVQNTSMCGLGQTAPNPVFSTLRYFGSEYDELLQDGTPAKQVAGISQEARS
ncbi:MAG: NADH-quinone oxidoreductase subunit NuoF [Planctomycetota bacterium]